MDYELIIVGGGLAGSTLAKNMAERGTRVLLLEREHAFRDRIRGEAMHPWGVVEARALGIYDELLDACGHVCNRWKTYFDGQLASDRDLLETNPHESGEFHFYHPAMQELLIGLAGRAGVDVHRGARLTGLDLEARRVTWAEDGEVFEATADLVVGADGSRSTVRRHAGFDVNEDQDYLMIAGVMLENAGVPDDSVHQFHGAGVFSILFPQGSGRTRSYVGYPSANAPCRLAGEAQKAEYLELLKRAGVPENWLPEAELTGPLAEFQGADKWVDHPARDGVVLVGDAAAKPDPSWGTGLSLTLRDVRTLRDELLATRDWDAAIHRYAKTHDAYYQSLHRVEDWFTHLLWDEGPEADARRATLLPRLEQRGSPDIIGLGPESPAEFDAAS